MNIHRRLVEYGQSMLFPRVESYMPVATVLHRVKEMQQNAGARPCGFAYDMIEVGGENVACMPDGGLGAMVERMAGAIDQGRRIDEMREAVYTLPDELLTLLRAIYCGHNYRDIPRRPSEAMAVMGISARAFYWRRDKLFSALEHRLCLPQSKRAA